MSKFAELTDNLQLISNGLEKDNRPADAEVIDKVMDILLMIDQWANAYPPDIFIPMTKEDWADHHEILKLSKRNGSAAAADCMRYVVTQMKASVEKMS